MKRRYQAVTFAYSETLIRHTPVRNARNRVVTIRITRRHLERMMKSTENRMRTASRRLKPRHEQCSFYYSPGVLRVHKKSFDAVLCELPCTTEKLFATTKKQEYVMNNSNIVQQSP
jgi:hypothetical protein